MSRTDEIVDLILKKKFGGLSSDEEIKLDKWKTEKVENNDFYERTNDPSWEHMQIVYFNKPDIEQGRAKVYQLINQKRNLRYWGKRIYKATEQGVVNLLAAMLQIK